jgi:hypothetical protein
MLCGHLVYRVDRKTSAFCFSYIQFEWPERTRSPLEGKFARSWRRKCVLFSFDKCYCQKWSSAGCSRTLEKIASTCEGPSSSLGTALFSGVVVYWLSWTVNDIGLVRMSQWTSSTQKSFLGRKRRSRRNVHLKLRIWLVRLVRVRCNRAALCKFTKFNITPCLGGESSWCSFF